MPIPPLTTYTVGEVALIEARFYDRDDNPVQPTSVSASVRSPDATVSPATIQQDGDLYLIEVPITAVGLWAVRVISTGAGQAAGELQLKGESIF